MKEEPEKFVAKSRFWQQSLLKQLIEQHHAERLPHGIILHTDQTSDLSAFLWQLATSLLCQNKSQELNCGHCKQCQLMEANSYPDMLWITKLYNEKRKKLNRDITVDQIRDLIYQLSLTNQYQTLKIAIIYPAERLNKNSANSLLKTLEEPEPDTFIILATHQIGQIPVTIRSRCQLYKIPQADKQQSLQWCLEQGYNEKQLNAVLQQGITDPVTITNLLSEDYLSIQAQCESQMLAYIDKEKQQNLVSLSQDLSALPKDMMRLVINGFIERLIRFNMNALKHGPFYEVFIQPSSRTAQALFILKNKVQRQLLFEENNLNVQLQIEDVLISLKTILTR
ncbi:MAG: hypothetical protein ISR69_05620 [Gammaproteobacteria bacterium]|nr:hypothetical protein [Gammaproteobacteria bacterium]